MGVPKFYRWLSERYPLINQILSDSTLLPEIDNFYLDMNGIIHACTHPSDQEGTSRSLSFREMVLSIFGYIDRIVTEIVKPKKLLFMAVDGVAPRAKLNQQRARRFRAAQERVENMERAKQKGETIDEENIFDTNAITPGTEFMEKVGKHLRWFIRKKMKEDPLWSNLEIVFSGHDVPGEGEHKIMQYIREARAKPDYPPNLRHCMYGQDADLIMLGLATHEPHFTLLREVIQFNSRFGKPGVRQAVMRQTKEASFQLLHISILREYIELDLGIGANFTVDRERLIDDFVFLTFLVGNDFLPHLPTLDISEHAFDVIFDAYKQMLSEDPGYIVENGEIRDFDRFERVCAIIGEQEASILKTREDDERSFNKRRRKFGGGKGPSEEEDEEAAAEEQRAFEAAYKEAMGSLPSESESDQTEETFEDGDFTLVSKSRPSKAPPSKILQRAPAEYLSGGAGESKNFDDNEDEEDEDGGGPAGQDSFGNTAPTKDYRGHYYFKKFKVIADNPSTETFLEELMTHYLKGLVWCLAYYVKGCISWTWYYPFHYGPMLIDMRNLARLHESISFDIGQPFLPFQQLLGCLPSASKALLPRPYQWLMTSEHSPILKYYPLDFQVDMDGKKNAWEAVVLLDFIDEKVLLAAEAQYCKHEQLTLEEKRRNVFGTVTRHIFDPSETSTYYSCNPDIGLVDIYKCHTTVSESVPSLLPGAYFKPQLVPGTLSAIAGFPTLTAITMNDVTTDFAKINVFGSASKYRSLVMTVQSPIKPTDVSRLNILVGRSVFVNYPQLHEARIVAVTTENAEVREVKNEDGTVQVVRYEYDTFTSKKWRTESSDMEKDYIQGRGVPGSGGLDIGPVHIRLRLLPLQGMARDNATGAKYKVFGKTEADVPAQLVLWSSIIEDPRFQEVSEMPVSALFPLGCEVVATAGNNRGAKGVIVGPHTAESSKSAKLATSKKSKPSERVVDVEFTSFPPEPSFGYAIAASVQDTYFPSREVCTVLKIAPSILGKLVGSLLVEPVRADLGLNIKKNGQYQLLGYVRRVDSANSRGSIDYSPEESSSGPASKAWGSGDTVSIVGSVTSAQESNGNNYENGHNTQSDQWEYTSATVALIVEYQERFPVLFNNLLRLPQGSPRYNVKDLFGKDGSEKNVDEILEWMKSKPFFNLPRTPLTTISMSRDAIQAVERAVDVRSSYLASSGPLPKVVVKSIPCSELFRGDLSSPFDAPLELNTAPPKLGDRVVNLNSMGVPCGLKGTVVCIHGSTGFVEVVFDEEFVGGRSLSGNCSQFRGRLCPWTGLLCLSNPAMAQSSSKIVAQATSRAAAAVPKILSRDAAASVAQNKSSAAAPAPLNQKTKVPVSALLPNLGSSAPAPAPVPVPTVISSSTLRPDIIEALFNTGDAEEGEEASAPRVANTIQVAVSDGTGRRALAAAAGFTDEQESQPYMQVPMPMQMGMPVPMLMPMGIPMPMGMPIMGIPMPMPMPLPVPNAYGAQVGAAAGPRVPAVAHNQRMPSPTKRGNNYKAGQDGSVPAPSDDRKHGGYRGDRGDGSKPNTAHSGGNHQQYSRDNRNADKHGDKQYRNDGEKHHRNDGERPARNDHKGNRSGGQQDTRGKQEAPAKDIKTMRKIELFFAAGNNPASPPPAPASSSDPARTPVAEVPAEKKPQSISEKLAAAKRSMKKSIVAEKQGETAPAASAAPAASSDTPVVDASAASSVSVAEVAQLAVSVTQLELDASKASSAATTSGGESVAPTVSPAGNAAPAANPTLLVPSSLLRSKKTK